MKNKCCQIKKRKVGCSWKNGWLPAGKMEISQFEVLDGLREFRQLDVFKLLREVHVLDGGEGAGGRGGDTGLKQK